MVKYLQAKLLKILESGGIENPAYESRLIIQNVIGCRAEDILLDRITPAEEEAALCQNLAKKRSQHYPLQYLLGKWEFYGHSISVGEGVLIPRQETELLCEKAIQMIGKRKVTVLDLCSGSGCIAVAVSKTCPNAEVFSVELSKKAIDYCKKNRETHGISPDVIEGDVLKKETAALCPGSDIIICNPPYLNEEELKNRQAELWFEPEMALYGGEDGLVFYREILKNFSEKLNAGGSFLFEIGFRQGEQIKEIMREQSGYLEPEVFPDFGGNDRVAVLTKKDESALKNAFIIKEQKRK